METKTMTDKVPEFSESEKVEKTTDKCCNTCKKEKRRKNDFEEFFDDSFFGFQDSIMNRFFGDAFMVGEKQDEKAEKKEEEEEKKVEEESEGEDDDDEKEKEDSNKEEEEEAEETKPFVYGYRKVTTINGNEKKEIIEKTLNDKKYRIEKKVNVEGEEETTKESFDNLKKEELEMFENEFEKFYPMINTNKALPEPKKKKKKKKKKKRLERRRTPFGIVRRNRFDPIRRMTRRNVWNPFSDSFGMYDPFDSFYRPRFVTVAI